MSSVDGALQLDNILAGIRVVCDEVADDGRLKKKDRRDFRVIGENERVRFDRFVELKMEGRVEDRHVDAKGIIRRGGIQDMARRLCEQDCR